MKITVFGLGKLGSVLAAVYSSAGHDVIGVDLDVKIVDSINSGKAPFKEPRLQDLIDASGPRLRATTKAEEALQGSQASYLILPTPSNADGVFVNDYLLDALTKIGSFLRNVDHKHVVVICSTVMPGSCDGPLKMALEESSGKIVGQEIGLVYSPEFIALGSVVHDMHFPDLILIGESDEESGNLAEQNALSVVKNSPKIARLNMVNAEITKIAINTFVTTKISFANMLSEICDKLPNAEIDEVTAAVGADSRIGQKYLKGALGYGGPCFPRDNIALTRLAEYFGVDATIARATDSINDRQVNRVVEFIQKSPVSISTVSVLGLSYKPQTPVTEKSQGIMIANLLLESGYKVLAYDPQANEEAKLTLKNQVTVVDNPSEAIINTDAVIVATAWPEFAELDQSLFNGKVVVDPWSILSDSISSVKPGRNIFAG